jgi:ABC-type bacteriocin/lantibiotic exporter with double-glycine peptidase domain
MGKILEVPRIKQLKNHCGVASLNMVLEYYNTHISQEELSRIVGLNVREKGSNRARILEVANDFKFLTDYGTSLDFEDIVESIESEVPIIVRVKYNPNNRLGHMIVVTGYGDNGEVYVNDPDNMRKVYFEYNKFKKLWEQKERGEIIRYGLFIIKP